MDYIEVREVQPNPYQRALRPDRVARLADKMASEGYNESYPITVTPDRVLVDGGHRVAAAAHVGIEAVPYLITHEPPVAHSLRCNRDGADTVEDDVFDLAERVWKMSRDGWTGQQIADELGWTPAHVSYHKRIKEQLHPLAWQAARGLTTNGNFVNQLSDDVVNQELTIVNWAESHFRAFLSALPCENGNRAAMRAQVRAIRDIYGKADSGKRITAKLVEQIAERHAWLAKVAVAMRDQLAEQVPLRDRVRLLDHIYSGVFGYGEAEKNLEKFTEAITNINERVLGVTLYHDDALQRIPLLDDGSVALVVADPPYNVTDHEWDRIGDDADYLEFTRGWLEAVRPKLADDYHLYLFCAPQYAAQVDMLLRADGWPLKSRIVWEHRNLSMGRDAADKYITMWEMVFHIGTHRLNFSPDWDDERFEVKQFAAPQSNFSEGKHHPTAKPVALIQQFVRHGSKPGDVVLDPFAGGGTTGAACMKEGQRRCILIERDDEYAAVIQDRLGVGDAA